jgi:trehalose 6-phosphate phosphatase
MTLPAANCAYFLDIDGTLVDFTDAPADVRPSRALTRSVERLYQASGGALALITGRSLADVDDLFPARLPAAGQHGLERRSANGRISRHRARPHSLDTPRRMLADVVARHPRLLLEDKGLSLALHYRRAPRLAGYVHRVMRSLQAPLGHRYCIQRGKRVVELSPAGRDKGAAIAAFMREPPFRGRTPLFIGDDVTDEYGFVMVNRLGGHAIKVGPGHTAARWRLANVSAVIGWLETGRPVPKRSSRLTREMP